MVDLGRMDEETIKSLDGAEVIVYEATPPGKMLMALDPAITGGRMLIMMHPLDYIWLTHRKDALARLEASSEWIRRQIDHRFKRLENKVRWPGIVP